MKAGKSGSPWQKFVAEMLIVTFVLLFTGCGSSNQEAFLSGSETVGTNGYFLGRTLLEDYAPGARVLITDPQNRTLYELTSDEAGFFEGNGPLPLDFRITVTKRRSSLNQGEVDDVQYVREVRGGYDGLTLYVNPLTTLVSRLHTQHGLSVEEAESRVKSAFSIRTDFSLDWITNSGTTPFSPARFQRLADRQGGRREIYRRLAEIIAGGEFSPILILPDEDPYDGEELQNLTEQLAEQEVAEEAAEEASEALGSTLLKTIGADVFADAVSLVDASIFGAVTQSLGLNLGTSGALNAISEQLDEVLFQLTTLSQEIGALGDSITYQADRNAIEDQLTNIFILNQNLADVLNGANNQTVQKVTADITSLSIDQDVAKITDYLLGLNQTDNIVISYAKYLGSSQLKQSDDELDAFLGYPVRFNDQTRKLENQLQFLLGHLTLAGNLYAENYHVQLPFSIDQSGRPSVVDTIDRIAATMQQAKSQVPDQLSDDSLLWDVPKNLMWEANFFPKKTYDDAVNFARSYQVGGYSEFRLPTQSELEDLLNHRIAPILPGSEINGDVSDNSFRNAFLSYGFDLTHYGEQTYVNSSLFVGGNTDYQGQAFFNQDSSTGITTNNVYQWYGVSGVPTTTDYSTQKNSYTYGSQSTFLLVRTTGQTTGSSEGLGRVSPFGYAQLADNAKMQVYYNPLTRHLSAFTQLEVNGVLYGQASTQQGASEVTTRCHWTSSNPEIATVSTVPGGILNDGNHEVEFDGETTPIPGIPADKSYVGPGPMGKVTWHPPLPGSAPAPRQVTFTATYWGEASGDTGTQGLTASTGSIMIDVPQLDFAEITSVQVQPGNQYIDLTIAPGTGVATFYYAAVFYRDGRVTAPDFAPASNTPSSQLPRFALRDSQGYLILSRAQGGGFISSRLNELVLYNTLPPGQYTIETYPPNATIPQTIKPGTSKDVSLGVATLHIDNVVR